MFLPREVFFERKVENYELVVRKKRREKQYRGTSY